MEITTIETELTSSITNIILVFSLIILIRLVYTKGDSEPLKRNVWIALLTLVALSATIGVFVHAFEISRDLNIMLYRPIYLFLGSAIALFVSGLVYDISGPSSKKKNTKLTIFVMLSIALCFFAFIIAFPDGGFFPFLIFQAISIIIAIFGYSYLAWKRAYPGSMFIVTALLIASASSVVQSMKSIRFTIIWNFDNNGAYHLLQIIAFNVIVHGIIKGFISHKESLVNKE